MGARLFAVRRYGYRPSSADARGTHGFRATFAAPTPQSADNRHLIVEVMDQGDEGSCVANATAQALRAALVHAGLPPQPPPCPSRAWLYWLGRAEDGDPEADNGTSPSSVLQAAHLIGIAPDAAWPYVVGDLTPGDRLWGIARKAVGQRLMSGYARITSTGAQRTADIKAALAGGHLVVFGTDVDSAFENLRPGDVWPGCRGGVLGGHALTVCGFDPTTWLICNSWGSGWCDNGYCRMATDAADGFTDLWILSSAPQFDGTV